MQDKKVCFLSCRQDRAGNQRGGSAVADVDDAVAPGGYGRGVVGDDDDGGVGAVVREAAHQGGGGVGVEGAVELVEEHDGAGAEEGARYGDALGLPLAEAGAGLVARGVESEGEVEHEVGGGRVEGAGETLVGGAGVGEEEVVADGAVEEGVPLRDVDEVAEGGRGDGAALAVAIDLDAAGTGFEQTEEELDEGGLSGSGGAYHHGARAGGEVVAEAGEDGVGVLLIPEV